MIVLDVICRSWVLSKRVRVYSTRDRIRVLELAKSPPRTDVRLEHDTFTKGGNNSRRLSEHARKVSMLEK